FDKSLLHAGIEQSQHTSTENKEIANVQTSNERLLHRADAPSLQQHINEPFRHDCADVDEEFTCDSGFRQRDQSIFSNGDFAEDAAILVDQRFAAAFEVIQDAIELAPRQFVKRQSPRNQHIDLV